MPIATAYCGRGKFVFGPLAMIKSQTRNSKGGRPFGARNLFSAHFHRYLYARGPNSKWPGMYTTIVLWGFWPKFVFAKSMRALSKPARFEVFFESRYQLRRVIRADVI